MEIQLSSFDMQSQIYPDLELRTLRLPPFCILRYDKGLCVGLGTSDPYVKFKCGGRLIYKSRTVFRELNPVWDESFTIPVEDPFQAIQIKVFDYDWGLQVRTCLLTEWVIRWFP